MPDKVLNFVKDHFLMDSVIRSEPLLVKRNVHYMQIIVHHVQAVHSAYNVLFLGTGEGVFRVELNIHNRNLILKLCTSVFSCMKSNMV